MRRTLAAVGTLLPGRSHCLLPPGCVPPSYTRGQPEGWAIASGAALMGGDRGSEPGVRVALAGQRTPRSEGGTQNPPGGSMPRWAHLRSRLFPYVEPFQADGGARPPRARGEGGVERGPTPRPSPLVARRPAAAACWPRRGLEPRRAIWAQGRRGGAAGTPLARGSAWTSRWGRAGGRQRRGIHDPTTQSARPVLPGSVPLPPIPSRLLLRRCPGSPGGGTRGAAAEGSGAAVAHAPGPGALQLPRPQLALLLPAPASGS